MILTFDILSEAGIRLPSTVGSAITIVGALVIGQASVSAGLAGPFMVIIIAITAVASFVIPALTASSSLLRYFFLILAALMGGFGIAMGLMTLGLLGVAAIFPVGGVNVECFYLTAWVETPAPRLAEEEPAGSEPPAEARLESRQAWWGDATCSQNTPVFSFEALRAGNLVAGPAIVEAKDSTYVVEPGWSLAVDRFHNVSLTAGGEQ